MIEQEPVIVLCGPDYAEVKQPVMYCPTCDQRRRMLMLVEAWRGAGFTRLTCGERYHEDEGRMERPFSPGWRQRSVEDAKALWTQTGRVRLQKELFP